MANSNIAWEDMDSDSPLPVGAMMSLGVNALVQLYPISRPTSQSCNGKIKLAMGCRCGSDSATSGVGMCARFAVIMSLVSVLGSLIFCGLLKP